MASVKQQSRKMSTTHTWFWHVRLVNKDGTNHHHPGWVVKVEREGRQGFNPNSPEVVEATWREAIAKVKSHLDDGPEGEADARYWELDVNILEWHWGKETTVAELY